jgi:hypothetical protein
MRRESPGRENGEAEKLDAGMDSADVFAIPPTYHSRLEKEIT